jgi:transcriptional regulator with XRE-family HTH domain
MVEQELKNMVGKNIKFFRFHRQISQATLAEKADISITFLSNVERGNNFPRADTLCSLAEALGVEVWELFKTETPAERTKTRVDRLTEDVRRRVNQAMDEVFEQYQSDEPR